ncbi:hypothetical protein HN873_023581 [Arachis hypogaea]
MGISNTNYNSTLYINADLKEVKEFRQRFIMGNDKPSNQLSQIASDSLISLEQDLINHTPYKSISELKESTENTPIENTELQSLQTDSTDNSKEISSQSCEIISLDGNDDFVTPKRDLSKISYIPEDFDEDRTFYLQIDLVSILPEIPSIFYRKYKDQLNQRMFFIDLNQNQVEVMIGKGHSCAYILAGFDTLVKFYELKEGGWMKVMFIGEDLFLITKVKDSAMISKTLPSPLVKFLLDVKLSTLNVNGFSLSTNQINSVAKYVDIHSQSDVLPKLPDSVLRENYNSVVNPVSFDSLTSNFAHLGFHSQNNDVLFTDSSTILPHTIPNIGTDQIILSSNAPIHHNCLPYSVSNINVNSPLTVSFECTNPIARKIGGHGDISSTNEYIPVTANNSYYPIPLSTPMQLGSRSGVQFTPEFISCQKLLSDSQILPNIFAMNAFPSRPKIIEVRFGKFSPLRMGLRWNDSRKLQLFLTKGWKQFAKMHRFKEVTLLKFSVAIGDESVMYVKVIKL